MKLNISCPINKTGYGISSLNIVKSLIKQKHQVFLMPIGPPSTSNQEDQVIISELLNDVDMGAIDIDAPYLKIWHQFDLLNHFGKGAYFAFPFFELDTFNKYEIFNLRIPDVILTTSKWAQRVVQNHVNTPTVVVPLGVDLTIFDHTIAPTRELEEEDKYIFLNIGKWEIRKCHDLLPDIFNKAFPKEKDVSLYILASETTNSYSNKEEIASWKKLYGTDNRIKVISGLPNHAAIAQLIANSNCGLYLSRAEGWNLELLETMAMNKPVIASNYSAHTEFCTKDNSFLVDIQSIEPAFDGKAFQNQGNWAKITQKEIDITIDHMRFAYKNRINTNINGLNTANTYTWNNCTNTLTGCISKYS